MADCSPVRRWERSINEGKLAGALALIWHDNEIVLSEAAGYRDVARRIAMGGTPFSRSPR